MTHPYFKLRWLLTQLADQQSRLKNPSIAAARDMSVALPNAAVPTNSEDTDDDYFAFIDSADTEASQAASDTTNNKCDLEVLQFLDDSKKDLEMLNRYPVVKKLFVQHNAVLPSSAPVERLFSFAGMITRPHRRSLSDKTFEQLLLLKAIFSFANARMNTEQSSLPIVVRYNI